MLQHITSTILYTLAAIAVGLFVAGTVFFSGARGVSATAEGTLTGYAWSDTIGWVSMSGTGYGIAVAGNGTLSGYAWSDNIGWISANAADLVGCPSNPCTAKLNGVNLQGWLKALAGGTDQSGGWDGWISLSGSNPSYGPTLSADGFSGYAWGSDVVGWVDMSLVSLGAASCSNGLDFAQYPSCTCPSGQVVNGSICTPPCADAYSCSGNSIVHTDSQCVQTTVQACVSPSFCSAGASTCLNPEPTFNAGDGFTGHLQVAPSLVPVGTTVKVYWDVSNVSGCSVDGGADHWTGASAGVGGKISSPILERTVFSLACTGLDDSEIQESVTVRVVPVFQEL